jgi:anti-sigma factor RsiW
MKIDDVSLLAYVDGELSADESAQVEHAMHESAEIAARVSLLRASQLPYQEAFGQQALPPVPDALRMNIEELVRQHRAADANSTAPASHEASSAPLGDNVHRLEPRPRAPALPRFSWPKLAVAFVAGAFCCGVALRLAPQLTGGAFATALDASGMQAWIKAAAGYQQLYSRDTVAMLQPDARVTATTVADIRQVDDLALQVPDLRDQGLTFKRIQRLRFHDKPLVQIVYLPAQGKPVALCVLKEAKGDAAPSNARIDGMSVVAWRRAQLGYALIGDPGAVDLDALGKQLYDGQVSTTIGKTGSADVAGPA